MRVVIVGGTGLIGRALAAHLAATGDDVVVLSRHPERARDMTSRRIVVRPWSVTALEDAIAVMDGADAVVNLAGASVGTWPWTRRRRQEIRASRLGPTRALVDAIAHLPAARRPSVLISASGSDGYTGDDRTPATESRGLGRGFLADVCRAWEAAAMRAEALGVRVVTVRIGLVLAHDAVALRMLAAPVRAFLGGRLGNGQQWVSWVHVDDVVAAIVHVLRDEGIAGPVNLVSPRPVRQADLARSIARVVHRPCGVHIPGWLVRLVMREMSVLILGSRRVDPARLRGAGFRFAYEDLDVALAACLAPSRLSRRG